MEGKYVRIFASDQANSSYYLINPFKGTLEVIEGEHANSNLYRSPGGRFVTVINSDKNYVSFFDSGIEGHGEHAHVRGTPKWGLTKASGLRPVHYYGYENDHLIFNDGDGTISHIKESEIHEKALARNFSVGTAHHGAPVLFNNNTIAVTEKDGSISGTLPERVKVVDMDGKLLFPSSIQTGGIHGEASNGDIALFGSTKGILKVEKSGTQELINYPASLGENWLGSIYYGKKSNTFVGFKSKVGLYKIDPTLNIVTVIEENDKLFSVTFDWEGESLVLLYTDGKVRLINCSGFTETTSKNLSIAFPATGTVGNPVVAATNSHLYITDGIEGKIRMYNKQNLNFVREFQLPGKPAKISLMGSLAKDEETH
jgi:DNA-binding beta-propeller fold protein YncE